MPLRWVEDPRGHECIDTGRGSLSKYSSFGADPHGDHVCSVQDNRDELQKETQMIARGTLREARQ
eukprot:6358708-Amphidinium_carterae.1